ncbi:MAG: O-antigen ligase family protein [Terriglobales bacterium]|jgi:O-antigen ligase
MRDLKPLSWVGIILGVGIVLYFSYSHFQYFGNVSLLGGIMLLELMIACIWKYDQRFFVLLIVAFVWAGLHIPLQGAWTGGRWAVLAAGAVVGFIVWTRAQRRPFRSIHLIAFFCVCAAFVSATVSPFVRMASLKALSLSLLFLYCATGARSAVFGRENRFFQGVLLGVELMVYGTTVCYFLGMGIWGNPNSMGAVMSIACFPFLLWGWLNSDGPIVKGRRLVALLLCVYLIRSSLARAGMVSALVVVLVFCICLGQYKLLGRIAAFVLVLVALTGMLMPGTLDRQLGELKDAFLYKGHKEEGVLGSRRTPWDKTVATIKEHPWFGTGYGTSPSGTDPGSEFGAFLPVGGTLASTGDTEREHGSSYMTIAEWVGLLGVFPFVALVAVTVANVWKVCAWVKRTADPRPYAIPLAMVVLSGLVHANFEDWLFAAGSYLALFFWVCGFVLADMVADAVAVPAPSAVSRVFHPLPASIGAVVSNR